MKKGIKILLTILLIIFVACTALAVRYKEYIGILVTGVTNNSGEIITKQEHNNEKLVDKINDYLDEKLREPTTEEKKLVEEGEMLLPELYSKILSERSEKVYTYNDEKKEVEESVNENYIPPAQKSDTDTVISNYMAQLYALQASFSSQAEGLISQGADYYNNLTKTQDRATARANTISHFTTAVKGLEGSCDAKVNNVIEKLQGELEAIGADTSIIKTIRTSYENEKSLKMSYYVGRYLK